MFLKRVFVVVYCVWYALCCCLHGVIKHDDDDDDYRPATVKVSGVGAPRVTVTVAFNCEW